MTKESNERADEIGRLHQRVTALETQLADVYSSHSWRMTAPVRAAYGGLGWFLQNARRASLLIGWLLTGQFSRAGNALLPYYQRYAPRRIRQLVPYRLQETLARWLAKQPEQTRPRTTAQKTMNRGNWRPQNLAGSPIVRIPGTRLRNPRFPTILVCAHDSREQLYGAERSFLDILDGFAANLCNSVVVIPHVDNAAYINELAARSTEVVSFHYSWRRAEKAADQSLIAAFEALVDLHSIDAVHVNTITLEEPLIAARQKGVPAVVHSREIITHDVELCERIGASAETIVKEVLASADYVIANSRATAACYDKGDHTIVLPNTVDTDELDLENDIDERQITVGLVSSNIVKKGIFDFADLAETLKDRAPNLRFVLVGPENQHTAALRRAQQRKGLYPNLVITGYVARPRDAFSRVNVVVNLSHFQESFGRTVLEAMAARRPVVAYDWGAIPELISHGETGYLVPYKDINQGAIYLERLARNPSLIKKMGEAARRVAVSRYSKRKFAESLQQAYARILGSSPVDSPGTQPALVQPVASVDVSVIVPNYNYERYLPERLGSIINQTVRPREILFLDDASSDNSVGVARHILEQSSIPFRIISNEANAGTYRQWLKGIAEAKGELVWIAEADDSCEPEMLAALVAAMQDERVAIACCQSKRVDENGVITAPDNLHHTNELDPDRWRHDYRELGLREVVDWMVYRNTIPNTSACLLRKSAIAGIEERLSQARFCGDRLLYAHMLRHGDVAYIARPLNCFRRHGSTVTAGRARSPEFLAEAVEVRNHICANFPVHRSQLPGIVHFLDKDYKVEGVHKNSEHPAVTSVLKAIEEQVRQNRRFAFITTNRGSFDGGSELWWRESAKRLRALGHDVVVLIKKWDPPPPFLDDFARLGIKAHFTEEQGFEKIVGFNPDLVVVSVGDQDEGIEYYGQLRKNSIPYIIVNRLTKEPRFWPIRKDRNDRVRDGYLGAQKVFFASVNNRRVMEERLGCKLPHWGIIYSPNHADRNAVLPFPPVSEGVSLAVPANIRFVHKGQDLIVEVMKQDRWKNRDVIINLYGVGEDEDRLREMVKKAGLEGKFTFHGKLVFVGREHEISQIWLHNQAVLLPSRMEGFANTVIHAMMSGRVPIVTNIGGHGDVIEDGVTGFIASDPTPEALDDAMERAYQRRGEWEEIGQRARQAMLNYLPEHPVADAVDKILDVVGLEAADFA